MFLKSGFVKLQTCIETVVSLQNKSFVNNFSFLATFYSNAGYSDISIDRNDFDAGFLITFRKSK
jgi:uncharacterized membrane protein